jgi:thiosulfate reductase cytochrome b subunit
LQTVLWAGWLLAICSVYLTVVLPSDVALRHYRYDVHSASVFAAYSPITWSLALGWLIWLCYTGNGGKYEIKFLED